MRSWPALGAGDRQLLAAWACSAVLLPAWKLANPRSYDASAWRRRGEVALRLFYTASPAAVSMSVLGAQAGMARAARLQNAALLILSVFTAKGGFWGGLHVSGWGARTETAGGLGCVRAHLPAGGRRGKGCMLPGCRRLLTARPRRLRPPAAASAAGPGAVAALVAAARRARGNLVGPPQGAAPRRGLCEVSAGGASRAPRRCPPGLCTEQPAQPARLRSVVLKCSAACSL